MQDFKNKTKGFRYFIVTETGELDAKPTLKKIHYDHCTLVKVNKFDYPLFDLTKEK